MVPLESCELDSFFSSLEEMENDNGVVVRQGEHFVLYEGFPAARPLAVLVVILSPGNASAICAGKMAGGQ